MADYILAIDQGTTSTRVIVFDSTGHIVSSAQQEFKQYYPQPGWVEHDAEEIWQTVLQTLRIAVEQAGAKHIAAAAITNQRETVVVWDKRTGKPVYNAIVWQDRRTAGYCNTLKSQGHEDMIRSKTGLVIDSYFSASKIRWILDQDKRIRNDAEQGHLATGTIDSWLIYRLTGGKRHITDVSNASRTMLFNINSLKWDTELTDLFNIPQRMLADVCPSSAHYGNMAIPGFSMALCGIAGDQQAALFGQQCFTPGMVKNTYGTGCFMMMNTGNKPVASKNKLLTTVAWQTGDQTVYALEGSVFIAGALVQWLRDGLGIISESAEVEQLASQCPDNGDVYIVPAFAGLGAPYWDQSARGIIAGLTRGITKSHLARAALEAICYQTCDVLLAMRDDSSMPISILKADGGASKNDLMMQFQSTLLGIPVVRPTMTETTALGAALLAGVACGVWKSPSDITGTLSTTVFSPEQGVDYSPQLAKWKKAIEKSREWTI